MLGVGLDTPKQRERPDRRRQRLGGGCSTSSTVGMVVTSTLAVTAWFARNEADQQRERAQAEAETARQTTRFMVDLFKVSDPSEALGNSITAREILDKGAARIKTELTDQPAIQATLMDTMGTVYTSLGLYDAALPLMQDALVKRRDLLGPGTWRSRRASTALARHWAQGELRGSRAQPQAVAADPGEPCSATRAPRWPAR